MRKGILLVVLVIYVTVLMGCSGWSSYYTPKLRSLTVFSSPVTSRSFLSESTRMETYYFFVTENGEFETLVENSDTEISITEEYLGEAYVDIYFQDGPIRDGNKRFYDFHVPPGFTVFSP